MSGTSGVGTWVFVRHGQSVANAEGWLSGHIDTPLTALGREQAIACRAVLVDRSFDRAFSSDLVRASETAELLRSPQHPAVEQDARLRERNLGDHQERDKASLRAAGIMAKLIRWEGRPPGGESQADLAARALPWFVENDVGGTTLVVAHGGLIRVVLGLLDGDPRETIGRNHIDNAVPHERQVPRGRFAELVRTLGAG